MRQMGIEALYRKPNTSRRHAAHPIYPYQLRNLSIDCPNHVWATDITYIPMRRGFIYLVAIVDWFSRRILAWCLSNTLYNNRRPHQTFAGKTPDMVHFAGLAQEKLAA